MTSVEVLSPCLPDSPAGLKNSLKVTMIPAALVERSRPHDSMLASPKQELSSWGTVR